MLDATADADIGAPYPAPPPARPFLNEVTAEPGKLRIAYTSRPFLGENVHADCLQGLQSTVNLLRGLGHELIEDAPRIDEDAFAVAFLTIVAAECRVDIEWAAGLAKHRPSLRDFEAATYALGLLGRALSASNYAQASRQLQVAAREIGRFCERYDLLLTPTLAQPPVLTGSLQPSGSERLLLNLLGRLNAGWLLKSPKVLKPLAAKTFEFIPYTPLFNVTGQPAMSVPLHWNAAGLPIGMHFVGHFGDEATLFRLAGQLERARPWFDRAPPGLAS